HSMAPNAFILGPWLAYLLGGLLCDIGWNWSLSRSRPSRGESDRKALRPGGEAAASALDPERRALRSMVWAIVALALLLLIIALTRWPNPVAGLIILIAWSVPLMLLGIREVSHQAIPLLVILGAPALFWGVSALMTARKQPVRVSGKGRRRAVFGTGVGASFLIGGLLLLFP